MTKKILKSCKAFLLDIIFPNRCQFCDGFIKWNELICRKCLDNLSNANDEICRKCGNVECSCSDVLNYDMVYATFFFDDSKVNEAIYRFKHEGNSNIAEYTAEDALKCMKNENIRKPDIVTAVPMGKRKQRMRGHNQSEILAESVGNSLNIPVNKKLLFKRDTKDEQHLHTEEERRMRVKQLFYGGRFDLSGMSVVLCDDVMTTGATVNECAGILKHMGADKIIVVVCAVTKLNKPQKKGD